MVKACWFRFGNTKGSAKCGSGCMYFPYILLIWDCLVVYLDQSQQARVVSATALEPFGTLEGSSNDPYLSVPSLVQKPDLFTSWVFPVRPRFFPPGPKRRSLKSRSKPGLQPPRPQPPPRAAAARSSAASRPGPRRPTASRPETWARGLKPRGSGASPCS